MSLLAALSLDAQIRDLATETTTHPHAIRAHYTDLVASTLDGDETARDEVERMAWVDTIRHFRALTAHLKKTGSRHP